MRVICALFTCVFSVSAASTAFSATLGSIEGTVSINRGEGYKRVIQTTDANSGDSVMASPGGKALITYLDGCTVQVAPGSVVTVGSASPCHARGEKVVESGTMVPTQATTPPPGAQPPNPLNLPLIIGGVVVVGGIAGAVILSSQNSSDPPASP